MYAIRSYYVNVYFKNNPRYRVVAFTATQIPDIEGRRYPPELAGESYPDGIPVYPEEELASLIRTHKVDLIVITSYSIHYTKLYDIIPEIINRLPLKKMKKKRRMAVNR